MLPQLNNQYDKLYSEMQEKWSQASVVGDKIPHLFLFFETIEQAYPDAKFIYILREIQSVSSSWNARALNDKDLNWPRKNDFRESVRVWNEANRIVYERIINKPNTIYTLLYEPFFSGDTNILKGLCKFLGVQIDTSLARAYKEFVHVYVDTISKKRKVVLWGQKRYIRKHADQALYRQLAALCMT